MAEHGRRVCAVLEILRESDESRPLTTGAIRARLAQGYGLTACARSVASDIAALRAMGHCIMTHPCRKYGYYMAAHTLEGYELRFLSDALFALPFFGAQERARLIKKLCALAAPSDAKALRRTLRPGAAREARSPRAKYALDAIQSAMARRQALGFRYPEAPSGALRLRSVTPLSTGWEAGRYCLFAREEGAAQPRRFFVEEMRAAAPLPELFAKDNFNEESEGE